MKTRHRPTLVLLGLVLLLATVVTACAPEPPGRSGRGARARGGNGGSDVTAAALATYVPPGDLDEYYLFYSGGHSGQIFVSGIPSMRHIATIPVFSPYPGTGYGFDDESKEMLGGFTVSPSRQ